MHLIAFAFYVAIVTTANGCNAHVHRHSNIIYINFVDYIVCCGYSACAACAPD